MPIIRKRLAEEEVYPSDLRYNSETDTVQSRVNGEWKDNPLADPRQQTTIPPRVTSDPACDAAESAKDAIKKQIDDTCNAIDASKTVFTIASIILAILSFGFYGVFIGLVLALVNELIGIGTEAINETFTPTVYHTFTCILYCHMDSSGRIKAGEFEAVKSDITEQIGGVGATVLHAMLNLAGEGGVNNLAALGTSTGSCDDCECSDCPLTTWVTQVGIETTRTDTTITVIAFHSGSDYIVAVNSPGSGMDCCALAFTLVSGANPSTIGAINCDDPQDGGHIYYSYPGGIPLNYYILVASAPFTARVKTTG